MDGLSMRMAPVLRGEAYRVSISAGRHNGTGGRPALGGAGDTIYRIQIARERLRTSDEKRPRVFVRSADSEVRREECVRYR